MPSGKYNLTGAYSAGVIAKNGVTLTIQNLANAELEGTKLYKENLSPISNTFIKDQSADNLPELSLVFRSRSGDSYEVAGVWGTNLYGSDIDKIIKKYYDNNRESKFSFDGNARVVFDAREYLNGSSMYQANSYNSSAYDLDINAALVMHSKSTANVNVVGERKTTLNPPSGASFMNGRFESDMSGVEFRGPMNGVIDIAGPQRDLTLRVIDGRLIVRKNAVDSANSSIKLTGGSQIDFSEISKNDLSKISTLGGYYTYVGFKNEEALSASSLHGTAGNYYGADSMFNSITAKQVENDVREGKDLPSLQVSQNP
jgi:hypothetical protein